MQFFLIVFIAAVVAGVVGSLLGLGGGVILVPFLTVFLGVPPLFAIGASIVSVIATSSGAASAYVRDGITNLRVGMFLELATSTGAVVGAVLTISLARAGLEGVVYVIFGLVLIMSVLPLLRRIGEEVPSGVVPDAISRRLDLRGKYFDRGLGQEVSYQATRSTVGLCIMYFAGLISGLLGIGSGALKVVALDVGMKLPMKVSSTTSNFMIGVTAAASTGIFYLGGYINPFLAAPVTMGVLLGSLAGTRLLVRAKNSSIRKVFIPIILILAAEMLLHGL
ncbi:MAG: sulfite exporter TauE/SafE family protein [Nitrososphaerota archaeon]|nr:sulfite exporter TauE/SafE family protein [Nitrososphaerota archaeon]MDG7021669.1 sulfite exporter TauE/SafE family protein [Nitrososphaerota archaeon]